MKNVINGENVVTSSKLVGNVNVFTSLKKERKKEKHDKPRVGKSFIKT